MLIRIKYRFGQGLGAARSRRRLGGGGGGRDRRHRVGLVDLEVGLDRLLEFVARPSELSHGAPQRASELWQVLRAEDEEGDHEDEDQLLETNVKHDGNESYHRAAAGRMDLFQRPPSTG